jgi:putative heme-binding domain-containing protein
LVDVVADGEQPVEQRLRALWVLMGATHSAAPVQGVETDDPTLQAWLLRNASVQIPVAQLEVEFQGGLPEDLSDVPLVARRQWVTELTRLSHQLDAQGGNTSFDHIPLLLRIAQQTPDDHLIQHLVWEVLREEIPNGSAHFVDALQMALESGEIGGLAPILPRATDVVLESADSPQTVVGLLNILFEADGIPAHEVCRCLAAVADRIQNRQLDDEETAALKAELEPRIKEHVLDSSSALHLDACILAMSWGWDYRDRIPIERLHETALSSEHSPDDRLRAFATLVFADGVDLANEIAIRWLDVTSDDQDFNEFRRQLLLTWARLDDDSVAATLLNQYGGIDPQLRATAIEVLTQRAGWSGELLTAIAQTIAGERADNPISKDDLNLNQLRRIEQFDDAELTEQLTAIYGQIREGRNPAREQMIDQMRDFLDETPGDPVRGIAVFNRVCGNCHKMHGAGNEVGPDITRNGRNNWEQLLSNVFDPSLVIGPGYQARQLATTDGRILTGLAVEESDEQVVLKIQGGKLETIPRDQIDEYRVSELSMMPEDLEKLIEPQEMADLFAYLALDLPPDDPEARMLPGAPDH